MTSLCGMAINVGIILIWRILDAFQEMLVSLSLLISSMLQLTGKQQRSIRSFIYFQDAGRRAFWSVNGPRILQVGYEDENDPKVMEAYERVGSLVCKIFSPLLILSLHSLLLLLHMHFSTATNINLPSYCLPAG